MSLSLAYYPGCSGQGTSVEYDISTRAVCRELGIELKEIPDWNCCGSTPAHTVDEALSAALSARVFAQSETTGLAPMTTPCPSCLKNLRNSLDRMEDPLFRARVEALTERPLTGEHSVKSVLQIIVEDLGLEAVAAKVKRPLSGLKVVPYYGCLMNRPAESMRFDDPENPMALDRLLESLGAEVLPFPLKVDCCGASFAIPARKSVPKLAGRILDLASSLGADAIVVACPLCQMNLDLRQGQINFKNRKRYRLPVPYFTQLMAYAFGLADKDTAFGKLAVPVAGAFACMEKRAAEAALAALKAQDKAAAAKTKERSSPAEGQAVGGEA
ncbi:CoB--CoM heterodisulfide reductase iron-sulfur subunit B family protein [Desulfovibrio sp. OttesenSCG-928-F20]|nr:CoB--CoM heterodisulfide reductase iron-sulfur subunit B family protein [Desulfovibrio sp. OttesenSCG-928-F20]